MSQLRRYTVQPNDTLSNIAKNQLGRVDRWTEIFKLNKIQDANRLIIGQSILLPPESTGQLLGLGPRRILVAADRKMPPHERPATLLPGRAFTFVIADEMNPLARKAVRKVLLPPKGVIDPNLLEQIFHPERHGFTGRALDSPVGMGRHVGGRTDSRFISASERLLGSPRFEGKRFWIDVGKAEAAGVRVHETSTIIADLDKILQRRKVRYSRLSFFRFARNL